VEQAVVTAACGWHAADIYVQPNLSRADAVRNGAAELIDAVERYKSAQPVFADRQPVASRDDPLGQGPGADTA
jgi:hypothetical protein